MKYNHFLKRFLCLLLICTTIFVMCSCMADDEDSETLIGSDSDSSSNINITSSGTNITLSGEHSFRIVYSSAYKSQAQKIANKLISLDKNYVKGSDKYALVQDIKVPEDGTPEIVIGNTNREATTQAKKLVSGKTNHYSICITNTAIAIYAKAKEGIDEGVSAFIKKLSDKDGAVVYDNSKGDITGKYTVETKESTKETEKTQALPTDQTKTPAKTDVDGTALLNALKNAAGSKAYSIAVSTTDGIEVAKIRNLDPQNTYSVSKVYCVTAIGMLYDEGKINPMQDTIGDIFKEEIKAYGIDENKWKNVTVHDVLRHRAGYTEGGLLDIDADPGLMNEHNDFLKVVLNYKLSTYERDKPIEEFGNIANRKYTDAAYYLISRVVSKISGQKLDAYLKTRLFDVAGYSNYRTTVCPQGYPIGATQFYFKPDDMVKLGRIYVNGGTYNGKRIISQEWVNIVIKYSYELASGYNGYGKGGMRGQYLYVNFEHNIAVAWLSETDGATSALYDKLKNYLP